MRKFKRRQRKFKYDEPRKVCQIAQPPLSPVLKKSKIEKGFISKLVI